MYEMENHVLGKLASDVAVDATSIVITTPAAPANPPPVPGVDPGVLTLVDDFAAPTKMEIITYTGVTDNGATQTLTGVTRAREGTTAAAFTAGDYFTQATTRDLIAAMFAAAATVQGFLDIHEADFSNPHAVTAAQVGADPAGSAAAVQSNLDSHEGDSANPHGVTKAQVGLGNADNTADADKPVSTAQQTALDGKEPSIGAKGSAFNKDFAGNGVATTVARSDHSHTKSDVGLGNVDNTSDAAKPISTATQTALDAKADSGHNHDLAYDALGAASTVQGNLDTHTGDTGNPHGVTKTQVGLANVDNTSDADKPVSTAQQTALDGKEPSIGAKGDAFNKSFAGNGVATTVARSDHSHTKADVGLGNVDNTSDANKPVSTAQQTALDGKAASTHNHAGTYAEISSEDTLTGNLKIAKVASLPGTPDANTLYILT